jgi:hypothetical protein
MTWPQMNLALVYKVIIFQILTALIAHPPHYMTSRFMDINVLALQLLHCSIKNLHVEIKLDLKN